MSTYAEQNGGLHVSGTRLLNESDRPVQLLGVSTLGLAWYPEFVNEEAFRTLRDDWGANVIRLAMYTCEEGGYMTGGDRSALLSLMDKGVRICRSLGMYVILDWHILSDGDPNTHADAAEEFFRLVSAKYADQPHVIYELCNEPNGPTVTWDVVKHYAQRILPVIRANAPKALVLCGTPNWSQDVDLAAADPLADENLMYVLHFYAATHTDALRGKAESAIEQGAPIFISECSICDASGNGEIDYASAEAWRDLIDRRGLSCVAWSLSNRDESSALIRADSRKTSYWTEDDLTDTGRWFRGMIRDHRMRK